MAGHQNWSKLKARMSPESRERAEVKAEGLRAAMDLSELLQARNVRQEDLAERLEIRQSSVSRTLRRRDMHVSTLRDVVEALGGELDVVARFPDGEVHLDQFVRHGTSE